MAKISWASQTVNKKPASVPPARVYDESTDQQIPDVLWLDTESGDYCGRLTEDGKKVRRMGRVLRGFRIEWEGKPPAGLEEELQGA